MKMTPTEKFNQQVWEILQRIKEDYIASETGKPIEYEFPRVQGVGIIPKKRRKDIFYKLQEWKAIKIINESLVGNSTPLLEFQVLQPKFDETYKKFQKACDLTTYLSEYQKSTLKGNDNLPEFNRLGDKKQTRHTPSTKHKGQMFETGSGGGYYNRNHPVRPHKRQSANEIVDGFSSSNYAFVLMVSGGILSASEFGSDGEVNYRLQSVPGQMLMQERQLLSKFESLGLFRNLGEDGIFAIAKLRGVDTKTIEQIAAEIKSRQLNPQTKSKGADLKARYDQLIKEIRTSKQTSPKLKKRYDKIIREITTSSAKTKKPFSPPSYNETSYTIWFKDKDIPIPPNSNQNSLCKVIFKNKSSLRKEWSWDEMLEKWGGSYEDKEAWRKVYNAGREVNKKVAIETGVKDFLIVKKLTIAVNPNYLK